MWKHRWNALFFLGSKITADVATKLGCLLLERKAMTNLDSILKSRGITLPTKVHIFKAMVFPVVMYGCELDHKKGWVLKNWLWTVVSEMTFERVPWTARRSNQSILKEINPEHSLEGLMLKLKLPYFTHLTRRADWKRPWCWERLKAEEDKRGWNGWHHQLNGQESEQTRETVRQGNVVCCSQRGHEDSDTTELTTKYMKWTNSQKTNKNGTRK